MNHQLFPVAAKISFKSHQKGKKCQARRAKENALSTPPTVYPTNEFVKSDAVFEYACAVGHFGLFHLAWNDACQERDGNRLKLYLKFLLLLFKADSTTIKYSVQCWFFLALVNVLLPESCAFEVLWNRTVNRNCTGLGKGIHKDLNREYDNRPQKEQIAFLSRNHTPEMARQVSQSMMGVNAVLRNFDLVCSLDEVMSLRTHKALSLSRDVEILVEVLKKNRVFEMIPARFHPSFPNFIRNPYEQDAQKLQIWLKKRARLTAKRDFLAHAEEYTPLAPCNR
eukprot:Pompholyxophrys_punicea_v1_NODE_1012_length_1043_cov_3.427126.p1 type:complete len:281 gc:universal NODE_1012_length_1043_cov_3.427126:941-99(-)